MPTWAANIWTWTFDICNSDKNYKKEKNEEEKKKVTKTHPWRVWQRSLPQNIKCVVLPPSGGYFTTAHIVNSLLYDCKAFTVVIKVFLIHFWSWSCFWKHSRLVLSLLSIWWHLWPEVKGRLVYVPPLLWPWPLQSIQLRPREFQADTSKGVLLWPALTCSFSISITFELVLFHLVMLSQIQQRDQEALSKMAKEPWYNCFCYCSYTARDCPPVADERHLSTIPVQWKTETPSDSQPRPWLSENTPDTHTKDY